MGVMSKNRLPERVLRTIPGGRDVDADGRPRNTGFRRLGSTCGLSVMLLLAACGSTGPEILAVYGDPQSRTLEVSVGVCDAELSADVEETAEEVRISVTAEDATTVADCADYTVVTLDEDLGTRRVINSRTGEQLDVEPLE